MDIAIIDDVAQDRLQLEQLVRSWGELQNEKVNLTCFNSGESFLSHFQPGLFSIVLLDLFMDGMDGMDTARALRRRGATCQIVFVTSSDTYAIQGYEVDAANYLLKPIAPEVLAQALGHCLSRLGSDRATITVTSNRATIPIPLRSIVWIESQRNALLFHTDEGTIKPYITMKHLTRSLTGHRQFLCCCKGILVNMDRIATVGEDSFVMDSGEHVPIRKRGANQVKQDYLHYLFSQGQG